MAHVSWCMFGDRCRALKFTELASPGKHVKSETRLLPNCLTNSEVSRTHCFPSNYKYIGQDMYTTGPLSIEYHQHWITKINFYVTIGKSRQLKQELWSRALFTETRGFSEVSIRATSARREPGLPLQTRTKVIAQQCFFLAEISVRSPWKLFIYIIYKKYFLGQRIQKNICFFLNRSTVA